MAGPESGPSAPPPPDVEAGAPEHPDATYEMSPEDQRAFNEIDWNQPRDERLRAAENSGALRKLGRSAMGIFSGSGEQGSRSMSGALTAEAAPMPSTPENVRVASRQAIERARVAVDVAEDRGETFTLVASQQEIDDARDAQEAMGDLYAGPDPETMLIDPDSMMTYRDAFDQAPDVELSAGAERVMSTIYGGKNQQERMDFRERRAVRRKIRRGAAQTRENVNNWRVERADALHSERLGNQAERIAAEHAEDSKVPLSFRNAPIGESSYTVMKDGKEITIETSETPEHGYGKKKKKGGKTIDERRMRAQGVVGKVPGMGWADPRRRAERREELRNAPEAVVEPRWMGVRLQESYESPLGDAEYDRVNVLTEGNPSLDMMSNDQESPSMFRVVVEHDNAGTIERQIVEIGRNWDVLTGGAEDYYVVRVRSGGTSADSASEYFVSPEQAEAIMRGEGSEISFTSPDVDVDGNDSSEVAVNGTVSRVSLYGTVNRPPREQSGEGDGEQPPPPEADTGDGGPDTDPDGGSDGGPDADPSGGSPETSPGDSGAEGAASPEADGGGDSAEAQPTPETTNGPPDGQLPERLQRRMAGEGNRTEVPRRSRIDVAGQEAADAAAAEARADSGEPEFKDAKQLLRRFEDNEIGVFSRFKQLKAGELSVDTALGSDGEPRMLRVFVDTDAEGVHRDMVDVGRNPSGKEGANDEFIVRSLIKKGDGEPKEGTTYCSRAQIEGILVKAGEPFLFTVPATEGDIVVSGVESRTFVYEFDDSDPKPTPPKMPPAMPSGS